MIGIDKIEVVNKIKILGVTVNNQLTWDENTAILVRKKSQLEDATLEGSLDLWVQYYRNGPPVETILPQCAGAILCGLGTKPYSRK